MFIAKIANKRFKRGSRLSVAQRYIEKCTRYTVDKPMSSMNVLQEDLRIRTLYVFQQERKRIIDCEIFVNFTEHFTQDDLLRKYGWQKLKTSKIDQVDNVHQIWVTGSVHLKSFQEPCITNPEKYFPHM